MQFTACANITDLRAGSMQPITLGGKRLLLANVNGSYYAIEAKCPHMGADLCKGTLVGAVVTCPRHRAGFDVTNGRAVDPAKILFLKMKTRDAVSFPVKTENGQILVGFGQ